MAAKSLSFDDHFTSIVMRWESFGSHTYLPSVNQIASSASTVPLRGSSKTLDGRAGVLHKH